MIFIIRFFLEFLVLILLIVILWIACMFSVFTHEIGHAIGYMIATRDKNWNIKIGIGKKVCKIGRFNIHLIPISGYFSSINMNETMSKTKIIATLIGGPLASLLLILVLFLVKDNINSLSQVILSLQARASIINNCIIFNLFMFSSSILPYKPRSWLLNGYVSDGWQILQTIKTNKSNK